MSPTKSVCLCAALTATLSAGSASAQSRGYPGTDPMFERRNDAGVTASVFYRLRFGGQESRVSPEYGLGLGWEPFREDALAPNLELRFGEAAQSGLWLTGAQELKFLSFSAAEDPGAEGEKDGTQGPNWLALGVGLGGLMLAIHYANEAAEEECEAAGGTYVVFPTGSDCYILPDSGEGE